MTRRKFDKLVRALQFAILTKHGKRQDGEILRKLRLLDHKAIIKEFGSYAAWWDWAKPVRNAYGMH
jgi:hypothetical protein